MYLEPGLVCFRVLGGKAGLLVGIFSGGWVSYLVVKGLVGVLLGI